KVGKDWPATSLTAQPQATTGEPASAALQKGKTALSSRRLQLWLSPVAIAMLLFIFFIASTRSKGPREALANSPSAMRMLAFTGPDEDAWQPSFSPDGKRIAFSRWGSDAAASGIYVKEIGADRQTQLTKEGRDRSASWSPDGNTIAFSRREDPNFA